MEVVLNSHIALLVLGYLYEEKLDHVSKYFCKYSPHLEEEYQIIKKGLRPVIINSDNLSGIVREHCYIKSKVNEVISTFPSNVNAAFERQTLTGKINHLLKIIKKTTGSSDDENKLKRTRSEARMSSSETSTNTTQIEDLPGYYQQKRRRVEDSYMFVRNEFSEESESDEDDLDNEIIVQSAFTDKILEDKNFQSRLLENINTALKNGSNDKNKNKSQQISATDSAINNQCDDNLDEMIQNIISVTEKDPSFEEFVHDVMVNSYGENIKIASNKTQKTANKGIQISPNGKSDLAVEEIKQNSRLEKPAEQTFVNRLNATEIESSIEKNSSATKFLVLNSTDFVSANIQSLGSFTSDHLFLDINGAQPFPILTGNDGTMYINSNNVQYDTRQSGNFVIVNPNQKNYENSQLILSTSNIEECDNMVNGKVEENLKENVNQAPPTGDVIIMDNSSYLKDIPSLDYKLLKEKKTPECNLNSVNISISKSLSTPRRKSSHVRVLNFSPLKIINKKSELQNLLTDVKYIEKKGEKSDTVVNPQPNVVCASNPIAENESSNSTDVTGEHSNITVIQCQKSLIEDTPKRKTYSLSCKRNLSRSNSEETTEKIIKQPEIKKTNTKMIKPKCKAAETTKLEKCRQTLTTRKTRQTKNNQIPLEKNNLECIKKIDPAEEWKQMRERSKNSNFDQFLREAHSKTPLADAHIHKRRKLRRKIGSKLKKSVQQSTDNKKTSEPSENVIPLENSTENVLENDVYKKTTSSVKKIAQEKKPKNIEPKTNFLNFRIKTPLKNTSDDLNKKTNKYISKSKIENKSNTNKDALNSNVQENSTKVSASQSNEQEGTYSFDKNENELQKFNDAKDSSKNETCKKVDNVQDLNKEKEKRTANIAHILDTPFKSNESNLIPPTPGIMLSSNLELNPSITPMTKLPFSTFCNMKYTEIKTPAFAITPGGRLCYSTDKETPKSGIITDYSSGGSYYKPDDSADLIKKLDRELNGKFAQRQAKLEKDDKNIEIQKGHTKGNNELQILETQLQSSTTLHNSCDSVIPEIIPCQVVLNKVDSFPEKPANVNLQNKFEEAGLPDITDESSTSSSSNSTSSDSSNSSSGKISLTSNNCLPQNPETISLLSNIDSSEDDDWEIQSISKNKTLQKENSEHVSKAGMKINVRRRITPRNTKMKSNQNLALKETISKHKSLNKSPSNKQIQKKKIEPRKKLENVKVTSNRNLKLEINRISLKREDKTSKKRISKKQNSKTDPCELSPEKTELNEKKLDVLTALNLSAKKRNTVTNDSCVEGIKKSQGKSPSASTDDNAVSDLFTLRMEEESVSNDSSEVRNAALTLAKMKSKKIDVETNTKKSVTIEHNKVLHENIQQSTQNFNMGNGIQNKEITQLCFKNCDSKDTDSRSMQEGIEKECISEMSKDELNLELKESQCTASTDLQNLNMNATALNPNSVEQYSCKNTPIVHESKLNIDSENDNNSISVCAQLDKQNILSKFEQDKIDEKLTSTTVCKSQTAELNIYESESESEDSYDECEPIFSKKCDEFVKHIKYDEKITNSSLKIPEKLDFVKSAIKITINNKIRKITCSEEFNLFHLEPNTEKEKSHKQAGSKKSVKSSKLKKEDYKIKSTIENRKESTLDKNKESTPFLGKIKITHRNKFSNVEVARKKHSQVEKDCSTERSSSEIRKTITNDSNSEAAKALTQESLSKTNIRSEDINAVLSHLYGNGK